MILRCRHCGHEWLSNARPGGTTRCQCGVSVRVPVPLVSGERTTPSTQQTSAISTGPPSKGEDCSPTQPATDASSRRATRSKPRQPYRGATRRGRGACRGGSTDGASVGAPRGAPVQASPHDQIGNRGSELRRIGARHLLDLRAALGPAAHRDDDAEQPMAITRCEGVGDDPGPGLLDYRQRHSTEFPTDHRPSLRAFRTGHMGSDRTCSRCSDLT